MGLFLLVFPDLATSRDVGERLPVDVADDEGGVRFLDGTGRREAARFHLSAREPPPPRPRAIGVELGLSGSKPPIEHKRWRHDGPIMSSQGLSPVVWELISYITKLSRTADFNRKQCREAHEFLLAHPDIYERFRDLADPRHPHPQGFPPLWADLLAQMKEENERAAREQTRRLAVLKK